MKYVKGIGLGICFLTFFSGASLLFAEDSYADDHAKDSVEQRQRIELEKFYNGNDSSGKAPMMPMAIGLYNDAVKYFQKGEYDLARQALKESLEIDKRNALAYELLGEIEDLQQNFEKAEEYYKQSFLLNPASRVRQRLEKLQKENKVDRKMNTYDEEHFIIKYREGEQGYDGYWLKNMLRDVYRQVSQDLGYYLNHKIVVLFYSRDEFHDVTGQGHFVGGLYDGKIRLPAFRQGFKETDLRAAATHEMTHAFIALLSGLRAPIWIHEGLAQYEENKVKPVDTVVFQSAITTGALLSIESILTENALMKKKDPLEIMLFYQEAYSLVSYIVQRYQMYSVKEMLGKFKDGKTAEEAIEESFSVSAKELERAWRATFSKS